MCDIMCWCVECDHNDHPYEEDGGPGYCTKKGIIEIWRDATCDDWRVNGIYLEMRNYYRGPKD